MKKKEDGWMRQISFHSFQIEVINKFKQYRVTVLDDSLFLGYYQGLTDDLLLVFNKTKKKPDYYIKNGISLKIE